MNFPKLYVYWLSLSPLAIVLNNSVIQRKYSQPRSVIRWWSIYVSLSWCSPRQFEAKTCTFLTEMMPIRYHWSSCLVLSCTGHSWFWNFKETRWAGRNLDLLTSLSLSLFLFSYFYCEIYFFWKCCFFHWYFGWWYQTFDRLYLEATHPFETSNSAFRHLCI